MLEVHLKLTCHSDVNVTKLQEAIAHLPFVREVTYQRGEWLSSRKESEPEMHTCYASGKPMGVCEVRPHWKLERDG